MKQIKNIMLIALLTLVGRASADNLTVEKVSISAGGTRQIAIELKNTDKQYEAFQFDLVLPNGITIAKNDKGNLDATLNAERKEDHSLTVKLQEDNSYRFLSYSMDDKAFKGSSGALVYVTLEAEKGLPLGDMDAAIKSQVLTDITGEVIKWDDVTFQIEVVNFINGDVNADNKVNGTDIQAVINVIVDEDYVEEADINKDNKVNGTDIQEIINIIVEEE
jgi:hypothetical protein